MPDAYPDDPASVRMRDLAEDRADDRVAARTGHQHQAPIACPYAPTGNAIACPKAWQTDMSAHVVVHPQPPAIRMHRCAYVGAHTAHMCPCGSYLVGGPA